MHRRIFQLAILLLWLALPLVTLEYRQAWDRLPARVATHFNAAGQANGWMPRAEAQQFGAGFVAFFLVIFTALLLYASRSRVDAFSWAMLVFCAVVLATMVAVNRSIIHSNIYGAPLGIGGTLLAIPIALTVLIVVYVAARREPPLPVGSASDLLAKESHSGGIAAVAILPAVLVPAICAALIPAPAARIAMGLVALIGFVAIVAAFTGFQYRFRQHGVEVSILGFRLRSIPKSQIRSYTPESWSPLRGYGIRGVGSTRAYVWGDKVVHIQTSNGDVYLGHSDPARIVHDLDMVMQHATR